MLVRLDPTRRPRPCSASRATCKVDIPGHGSDKINARLRRGRARAHAQDRQAAAGDRDQPRRQRQLQRLLGQSSTRSAASTSTSTAATSTTTLGLRRHRHPARLPEDLRLRRRWSTCASARRTPTSCARRASRTSCARPRRRSAASSSASAARLLRIFGRYAETDKGRARSQILSAAQARALLGQQAGPGGPVPAIIPADGPRTPRRSARRCTSSSNVQAAKVQRVPDRAAPPVDSTASQASARSACAGAGSRTPRQAGENEVDPDRAQGALSPSTSRACGPRARPTSTRPARLQHPGPTGAAHPSYRMVAQEGRARRVLRRSRARAGRTRRSSPSPHETLKFGGSSFDLYCDGNRIRMVAWKTPRGLLLGNEHAAPVAEEPRRCMAVAKTLAAAPIRAT